MVWPRTDAAGWVGAVEVGEPSVCADRTDRRYHDGDAPIGCGQRIGRDERIPFGIAGHASDAWLLQTGLDQQPARCVGAFSRQFPVRPADAGKRRRVGMASDRDVLRQACEHRGNLLKQKPCSVVGDR